jgi:hypothetical protein
MKKIAFLFALLLCECVALADEGIEVPAEVKGQLGSFLTVKAATKGKVVVWAVLDDDGGLSLFPSELLKDSCTAVVVGKRAGTFRLQAITAIGDVPSYAIVKVTIEGPTPPTPPSPPPKPPDPPQPTSPLFAKLQAAYASDPAPASVKAGHRVLLQGIYEAAQAHASDQTILTTGALLDDLKKTSASLLAPNALIEVRKVIASEVAAKMGTDATQKLDASTRTQAVSMFGAIAQALGEVK